MPIKTKARDLKVGDVILDGIASRVDVFIHHEDLEEVYMEVIDGNGHVEVIRARDYVFFDHFADWTEEDWQAYRDL